MRWTYVNCPCSHIFVTKGSYSNCGVANVEDFSPTVVLFFMRVRVCPLYCILCSSGSGVVGRRAYACELQLPTRWEIPEPAIWQVVHDVGQALRHVHAMQLVHLDVKPANLLIGDEGVTS